MLLVPFSIVKVFIFVLLSRRLPRHDIDHSGQEHKQENCARNRHNRSRLPLDVRRSCQVTGLGAKFGRKQEEAIAALLTQRNIEEAAKSIGVAPKTLLRWLKIPEFQ